MANTIGTLSFVSSKQKITINLKGINNVSVDFGTEIKNYDLNKNKDIIIEHDFGNTESHHVSINNAQNITEVDISSNEINNINLHLCTLLKKFVAYNNNFYSLDFTNSDALQYVHIQNNPICTSKGAMVDMINSLTDRNNKAFGSIVMYDFVPPRDYENMTNEQIFIRALRKELESISIQKDWYFGSAILYHETESKKVNNNVLTTNVIDVWESAEYGEGIVYADIYNMYIQDNTPEWDNDVFLKKYDITDQGVVDTTQTDQNATYDSFHGSAVNSILISQGEAMYGLIPKAKVIAIQRKNLSLDFPDIYFNENIFNKLNELENLDFIQSTTTWENQNENYAEYENSIKSILEKYKIMYFVSAGNAGDRNEETPDPAPYAPYADLISGSILDIDTNWADINSDLPSINNDQIKFCSDFVGAESLQKKDSATYYYSRANLGTSYSTPVTCGVYAVLRILYKKKYGNDFSLDNFKNYIYSHAKPLYYNIRNNNGYGKLNCMYYNDIRNDIAIESVSKKSDLNLGYNNNLDTVLSTVPTNPSNRYFHLPYKLEQDFILSKNLVYPLKNDGSVISKRLYSDSDLSKFVDLNITFPNNKKYNEITSGLIFSLSGNDNELKDEVSGEALVKTGNVIFNGNCFKFDNGYLDFDNFKFNEAVTVQVCVDNIQVVSNKYQALIWWFNKANTAYNFGVTIQNKLINSKTPISPQFKSGALLLPSAGNLFEQNDTGLKVITLTINILERTLKMYINGILVAGGMIGNLENTYVSSSTVGGSYEDMKEINKVDNLRIGSNGSGSSNCISPNFYAVRIFDRELTVAEVVENTSALIMNAQYEYVKNDEDENMEYKGSLTVISGLTQANNGDFPLVDGDAVQFKDETNEDGSFKSVAQKIEELAGDQSKIATTEDVDGIIIDLFG